MKKFLGTALKVIIFFVGWAVCAGLGDIPSDNPAIWRLGAEALPLLYIVVFSIAFWLIEKRRITVVSFQKPVLNVTLGSGLGVVWIGVAAAVMYLTGVMSFSGSNQISCLAVWLIACFLNVIMQELLVRGYIYQLIKNKCNMWAALIVSTGLFTAMHGGAFEAGVIAVLNVVTMSVFVTLVMEYTGSIIAPIFAHAVWNGVGAIILGGVSLADDYPHLFNTVFSGDALLSGGSCKIEGSIVVLILNTLLSIVFFLLLRKKKAATLQKMSTIQN